MLQTDCSCVYHETSVWFYLFRACPNYVKSTCPTCLKVRKSITVSVGYNRITESIGYWRGFFLRTLSYVFEQRSTVVWGRPNLWRNEWILCSAASICDYFCIFIAFLAALFVDKGIEPVEVFCKVCLFPRLRVILMIFHVYI